MTSRKRGKKRKPYLSPGVYVEEVPSGARPIEAVGTAVAAFVGIAPPNPKRAAAAVLVVAMVVLTARSRRAR
jgi:phage tail sheath protein FI